MARSQAVQVEPETDVRDLYRLYANLDVSSAHRVEILEGRIVVSPSPTTRHGVTVQRLLDAFRETADAHGWWRLDRVTVDLRATGEWIEPDLTVVMAQESMLDEWLYRPDQVVLVAEVVSPTSGRDDRIVKPRACARSGVPLYLLVDPVADPATATMLSRPGDHGYERSASVPFGEALEIPEPVRITMDTGAMRL